MFVNKSVYLALAACIGLAACSTERLARFPSYKLAIVQGNELDLQAVASLHQGLSKEQVQHMVVQMLKLSGKPQADAADGLAVALTHALRNHSLAAKLHNASPLKGGACQGGVGQKI